MFESNTKDDKIIISYTGKKNKKLKSKEESQVQFTLHKHFIDTSMAINRLTKILNKKPNDFNVAGNKDKRGITT